MSFSENVLQRELEDSGIVRGADNAEVGIGDGRVGIPGPEGVRHVVRLSPKFQSLSFADLNDSGQGHVEGPCFWTLNTVTADISKGTQSRQSESRRVEITGPGARGLIAKRISQNLTPPLTSAIQCSITAGKDGERVAGRKSIDSR